MTSFHFILNLLKWPICLMMVVMVVVIQSPFINAFNEFSRHSSSTILENHAPSRNKTDDKLYLARCRTGSMNVNGGKGIIIHKNICYESMTWCADMLAATQSAFYHVKIGNVVNDKWVISRLRNEMRHYWNISRWNWKFLWNKNWIGPVVWKLAPSVVSQWRLINFRNF